MAQQPRSICLAQTIRQLEAELDHAWAELVIGMRITPGSPDETALAELVVDDPAEHDWRVVDAALDRLVCTECTNALPRLLRATCRIRLAARQAFGVAASIAARHAAVSQ